MGRRALLGCGNCGHVLFGHAMQGRIYGGASDILDMLGLAGDLGNGLLYFVSRVLGLGADQVQVTHGRLWLAFHCRGRIAQRDAAVDAHNNSHREKS